MSHRPILVLYSLTAVLVFVLAGTAEANEAPQVTNVIAVQRVGTHLVDISYDAVDADGDLLTISVFLSTDGGVSYPFECTTLSGDYGDDVVPGTGLSIVWDAGTDLPEFDSDRCSIRVLADDNFVPPTPDVDIYVLLDRSGSMGGRWGIVTQNLTIFFQDENSAGLSVALNVFPANPSTPCDPASYNPPLVDLVVLPDSWLTLVNTLNNYQPTGLAPTHAALDGTLQAAVAQAIAQPVRTVAVVLITDGDPNECIIDINAIALLAANAYGAAGILTYAVGLGAADTGNLDLIAVAGGTTSSYYVIDGVDDLYQTMVAIRDDLLGP